MSTMVNKHWLYKTSDLVKALAEHGIPHSRRTLWLWEKSGRLVLPRRPSGHKAFTKEIIDKIVKALSPEGKGFYRYSPRGND